MPTPESIARQNIDAQLNACVWMIQHRISPAPVTSADSVRPNLSRSGERVDAVHPDGLGPNSLSPRNLDLKTTFI
jgi:hypothetical protein